MGEDLVLVHLEGNALLDGRRFRLSSPPANNCRRKNPPRHHGRSHSPGHNRCPSSAWSARSECSAAASAIPWRGRISMRPFALHKPHSTWERWRNRGRPAQSPTRLRGCPETHRHPWRQDTESAPADRQDRYRSEEHTSELQSLMRISYAVFCLKKKKKTKNHNIN